MSDNNNNNNNNKSDFDKMVESIQGELDADAEATFSKIVLDECKNPQNIGRLKNPDGIGKITGSCGDTMEFHLRVKKKRVTEIQFITDGCAPTIACGSMLTKMVIDKILKDVSVISNQDLIKALDGLPEENLHCAKLAVDTLQKALENYLTKEGTRYM